MNQAVKKVLVSKEAIAQKVRELGEQITRDYEGQEIVATCILNGAFIFAADLVRAIDLPMSVEFLIVSSYGDGTESSGTVEIKRDFGVDIEGKHVLIIEDIIDSGQTLNALKDILLERNPASLKICTLLDKKERRLVDLQADYVGFSIPNEFVVGYGLDFASHHRNYPDVCVLKEEEYC